MAAMPSELQLRLTNAAKDGDFATAYKLLKHKVSPNIDGIGCSPLLLAVKANHITIVKILLEAGAKPLVCDSLLNTSFHYSAMQNNVDILLILLSHVPESEVMQTIQSKNSEGHRPIDFAKRPSKCYSTLRAIDLEEDYPEYEEISDVPELPGFSPPKLKTKKKGKKGKGKGKAKKGGSKKKKAGKKKKKK